MAIGIRNVNAPKTAPRLRFRRRWNMSISSPARNMRYSSPTCPKMLNELSRSRILRPKGPTATPATIMPMICGIFNLFNATGASRMMTSTIRNILTGSVTSGAAFSRGNSMAGYGNQDLLADRYSAICTALRAAPLRIWSLTVQKVSELSPARSWRIRPTYTGSQPASPRGIG